MKTLPLASLLLASVAAAPIFAADSTPPPVRGHADLVLLTPPPTSTQHNTLTVAEKADGWHLLFDGKSLNGWKASEHPPTFSVKDGLLVVDGPRAHLFYTGPVANADFKNFELRLEALTYPNANSGIYFHTAYQETGWPTKGYEVQINNTHSDKRKTGGVYAIQDNLEAPVADETWFRVHIRVEGKRIITWINDRLISDYTEEDKPVRPANMAGRLIDRGTIAIQGHDPKSRILYRNIAIKPLP